ncbi:MAG: glycosyltransferase family 2 protein [Candidatus Aceula meridiana]|nr:glycosyltransferase family 2 protein [Candidatus Aceula meridiana]
MTKDLTIIIPAFNEEGNIRAAIESVVNAIDGLVEDYEIIVINDASEDNTQAIAQEKAHENLRIKVVANEINSGLGGCLRKGAAIAEKTYTTFFPGDNDLAWESWRDAVKEIGSVDLIISYKANHNKQGRLRKFISKIFTVCMNVVFGLRLKGYTGPFICKTKHMQSLHVRSNGLAAIASYNIRFLKSRCTYKEIPFIDIGRREGKTKALRPRSFLRTLKTVFILLNDIYVKKNL